jgi:valyl-tRNA synthetase
VMITSRDIIFLWVARMVMLGMKFVGEIPFPEVFITPLVFDLQGRKMSKSVGNSIDPMDMIAKYGADALRFGILRQMRIESQELRFDERFCEKGRDFNTKMWNALRYVRSLPEGLPPAGTLPRPEQLSLADKWILAEFRDTIERVTKALDAYEFGVVADTLLDFVWYKYCDWYVEATKAPTPTRAAVLSYVLNGAMRLLHPVCPFVTEEIWQALPHDGATIVTASWPDVAEIPYDAAAVAQYEALQRVVGRGREMRTELGLAPREKLTLEVPAGLGEDTRTLLALHANATLVAAQEGDGGANGASGRLEAALGRVAVRAPTDVLHARYERETARLQSEIERLEKRLENEQFVAKAPADKVDAERAKLAGYRDELTLTRERLVALRVE